MNEEYYRANFSSATSTYVTKDQEGNRLAVLDVQLPSSLLDPESEIVDAKVMLTKASIPLSGIPKVELETNQFANHLGGYNYRLRSRYYFTLGTFFYASRANNGAGGILSPATYLNAYFVPIGNKIVQETDPTTDFRIKYPYISYKNLSDFQHDINLALEDLVPGAHDASGVYNFPHILIRLDGDTFQFWIQKKDWVSEKDKNLRPLNNNSFYDAKKRYFSLCMSENLGNLFHGLPLVDLEDYWNSAPVSPESERENLKDLAHYALNLENIIPTFQQDDDGLTYEVFSFQTFNTLTLSPLTSIVIYSQNFPIEGQTHGVASETGQTLATAQTSSMYILDVFYPLLSSVRDLEDVLIISKDAVTTSAPGKISPNALTFMHNITFNFGYISKQGYLRPIIIPPNSNLSFQLTFILSY